jgi:hypothetical protein
MELKKLLFPIFSIVALAASLAVFSRPLEAIPPVFHPGLLFAGGNGCICPFPTEGCQCLY